MRAPIVLGGVLLVAGISIACDDPFAPRWSINVDTVQLFSMARPELGLASAFNFVNRKTELIQDPDASDRWDLALDTQGGRLVLLPPRVLGVVRSRAMIATLPGRVFEDVIRAPSDSTDYVADAPVPVDRGIIYVIQTRQEAGRFGSACVYYAKMEALDIDVPEGILTFRFDASPVCNDRDLIPPD